MKALRKLLTLRWPDGWPNGQFKRALIAAIIIAAVQAPFTAVIVGVSVVDGPEAVVTGDGNDVRFAPADIRCPEGFSRTDGQPTDGDGWLVSCSDGRYILTIRETGKRSALDSQTGTFVDPGRFR